MIIRHWADKNVREYHTRLRMDVNRLPIIPGIERVQYGSYSVTVFKGECLSWDEIEPKIVSHYSEQELMHGLLGAVDEVIDEAVQPLGPLQPPTVTFNVHVLSAKDFIDKAQEIAAAVRSALGSGNATA